MTTAETNAVQTGDRWARIATWATVVLAAGLVILKLAAWLLSGSVAVLGSLADSTLDLAASGAAFFAVRYAAQPPDANHRFGHHKAEAISALFQTALIAASATLVLVESVRRLAAPAAIERADFAIAALVVSSIAPIGLVLIQSFAIKKSGSLVLVADRAHYMGDVVANVGVLIAVILSAFFQIFRADAIAGLVAAGFLFWSVREVVSAALPQLMDEELPDAERNQIIAAIVSDSDVQGFHNLRTRRAGAKRFIQVDLEMSGSMSLSAAHAIAQRVTADLKSMFPDADVVVHQDIHNDLPGAA